MWPKYFLSRNAITPKLVKALTGEDVTEEEITARFGPRLEDTGTGNDEAPSCG